MLRRILSAFDPCYNEKNIGISIPAKWGQAVRKIERVTVVGLGSLGAAYASKLYDLNPDSLSVLAGGERAARYKTEGIFINGKRYDFKYKSPEEAGEPADFILVAVKAYQLQQAIADMKHQVGEHTLILSVLNGITSEEEIGKVYGMDKLVYAASYGLTANREGNHIRFPSYGNLAFGEAVNEGYSDKVEAIRDLLERAGIPYNIPVNMLRSLWWKFMVNVGINQCSAVTGGRYRLFQNCQQAKDLMEAAMREVILLSEKTGVFLNESDIGQWYEILNRLDPDSRTSMLEDIECRRRTEVDSFAGTVCDLGKKYGVDTTVNLTLYQAIKAIEAGVCAQTREPLI